MYLSGPLFFATQDKLKNAVEDLDECKYLILSIRGVPSVDDSATNELMEVVEILNAKGIEVFFSGMNENVKGTLEKTGFFEKVSEDHIFWDALGAMKHIEKLV